MRKHPLLALTVTFGAPALLYPATAIGGTHPAPAMARTHRSSTPPTLGVRTAATYATYRGGSRAARAVLTSVSSLTGPPRVLVQLPRLPRKLLTLHRGTAGASGTATLGGVWQALRRCESGDNYRENTGNGYYGAYQFAATTWWGIGFGGLPSSASATVQDAAAQQLRNRVGWSAWPQCAAVLGL